MVIVGSVYVVLIWLIFFQFKLVPWNKYWGTSLSLIGIILLAVVVGLLNFFTPSGRITVQGKVVELTPNVAGLVTEVFVQPNTVIKEGTPLFQIDPEPFALEVERLEAALVETENRVAGLTADLRAAESDVKSLSAEIKLSTIKRRDIETLVKKKVKAPVELDKASSELASLEAQRQAAIARVDKSRLSLQSEIAGSHTSTAQSKAQLALAKWELRQATPLASTDGYATVVTLAPGQRVSPLRSALAFVDAESIAITGVFNQNGFQRIRPGVAVRVAFASVPGQIFDSKITEIVRGIGEGQISPSGTLPTISAIGSASQYVVRIAIPEDVPQDIRLLGMSGTATVFAEDAGAIALLAKILLWIRVQLLFL
jgi:multidrug resistance efflux pump